MERTAASRAVRLEASAGSRNRRPQQRRQARSARSLKIVFAFAEQACSLRSLERATGLACLLEAELHAVCVMRAPVPGGASASEQQSALLAEGDRLGAWIGRELCDVALAGALQLRAGGFVEQVAAHARQLGASLVVTPAEGIDAVSLTELANAARLPVLAARERARGDAIVAATDLVERSYPVLSTALLLSRKLGAPLTALYNLSPASVLSAVELILSAPKGRARSLIELAQSRLERALRRLPGHARPVLASETDPVEAILREARAGDVDLIAVGTRPKAGFGHRLRNRIAVRVMEGSRCSVLVVPIQESASDLDELAGT